jgi:DNA-binding MarR family transcriptional regulator
LLAPTEAGAELATRVEHELRDRVLELMAPLADDDRDALGTLLSRVLQRAEELLPPE